MKPSLLLGLCALLLNPVLSHAAGENEEAAAQSKLHKRVEALHYRDGQVELRSGLAKINLPSDLRYLGPDDAKTVIEEIWGNPPSREKTLGMLVPAKVPLDSEEGWAVVITYEEDGYVKDDDAHKLDYDDLLKQMRASLKESNAQRLKAGYPAIELVGWATPPRYDSVAKKMYWAKELKFDDSTESTLNYNIRVLGRRGVLVLNAVGSIDQLANIEAATPMILGAVDFQEGHRYSDFVPGKDKTATYGLAALVAGGVLAKTGLLKVIIGGLLAAKKFLIIGVIALFGAIKKFFTGRSSNQE